MLGLLLRIASKKDITLGLTLAVSVALSVPLSMSKDVQSYFRGVTAVSTP